jgi:hypothetical protein
MWRVLPNVDRVDAQGAVGWLSLVELGADGGLDAGGPLAMLCRLGVRIPEQHYSRACREEFNHTAHAFASKKVPTIVKMGHRVLLSNERLGGGPP